MILASINQKIAEAMKSKDEVRVSTLRLLSSALNYERIAKQHDLSEEEELAVVRREIKKRKDAIEAFEKVGASDRAERERLELAILKEYLPEELGEEELAVLIEESIESLGAKSHQDAGRVIGEVLRKAGGRVEGSKVAEFVRARLA